MHFKLTVAIVAVALVLMIGANVAEAKMFDKCSLAKEMSRLGVPRSELPDWVCLAQYESSFNTKATNKNKNNSQDWGIFQINDKYWCKPSDARKSHNSCNISCEDLLTDDITQAVKCASLIKKKQGFKAWSAWKSHCQTSKPSVNECF